MAAKPPTNLGRATIRREVEGLRAHRGDLARLALYLAAAALLGHWQASRPAGMAIQQGLAAVATPLLSALAAAGEALRETAATLPRARQLAAENQALKKQLARMRQQSVALAEQRMESERLRALLGLRRELRRPCTAARVIGRRLSRWPTAIIIDKGEADGVRPRQVVTAAQGLVGRIYSVEAHRAVVIPLTDRNSLAGAMIQRSRDAGILEGEGAACRLNYLPLDAEVKPGDLVISSGLGGIFPKGLAVGTVTAVTRDDALSAKSAEVRPSVDLTRLEEVLVILK